MIFNDQQCYFHDYNFCLIWLFIVPVNNISVTSVGISLVEPVLN